MGERTVLLCEAAKHGRVDELRDLLASASPCDVNASVTKHGYRPLHYGAGSHLLATVSHVAQPGGPCPGGFQEVTVYACAGWRMMFCLVPLQRRGMR